MNSTKPTLIIIFGIVFLAVLISILGYYITEPVVSHGVDIFRRF